MAKAYGAERRTMGKPIDQHEMIAENLDGIEEIDRVGLRALAFAPPFARRSATSWSCSAPLLPSRPGPRPNGNGAAEAPDEVARRQARSHGARCRCSSTWPPRRPWRSRLTPADPGGNGYMTRDRRPEVVARRARVPVYEGTSQIQALMATKDALGAPSSSARKNS